MLANLSNKITGKKMKNEAITKSIISTKAQNNFGRLLDDVSENRARYIIKRFGTPKAVIICMDDFERLLQSETEHPESQKQLQMLRESRQRYHLGVPISEDKE